MHFTSRIEKVFNKSQEILKYFGRWISNDWYEEEKKGFTKIFVINETLLKSECTLNFKKYFVVKNVYFYCDMLIVTKVYTHLMNLYCQCNNFHQQFLIFYLFRVSFYKLLKILICPNLCYTDIIKPFFLNKELLTILNYHKTQNMSSSLWKTLDCMFSDFWPLIFI